jgi:hypothetical protein
MRSRRSWKTPRIRSEGACDELSASITAYWFGCGGHESVFVTQRVKNGASVELAA